MAQTLKTIELAAEAGVSRQMISLWAHEGLAEAAKLGYGKWDREAALAWIADKREDTLRLDGKAPSTSDLVQARIRLYEQQARGRQLLNEQAEKALVSRSSVRGAFSEVVAECIAAGDAWARDHTTPACAELCKHVSAARVLAMKMELWHELRREHETACERADNRLASGEDVGAPRIRVSGRVGR